MDLRERFEAVAEDEYLEFDRIAEKLSQRPDIHAFILLDKLMPAPGADIITAAEHDVFYIGVEPDDLNKAISDEQILELVRCGVHYDSDGDGLAMFA